MWTKVNKCENSELLLHPPSAVRYIEQAININNEQQAIQVIERPQGGINGEYVKVGGPIMTARL